MRLPTVGFGWRTGLLLATFLVPPVGAFETGEAAWNTSAFPIPYWIDPRMATTTEGVISPEVVQQAFARWSDLPSSSFAAEYRGFRGGANQNPNECRIGLEYIPPGVFSPPLARTRTDIVGDTITGAEILFNTFYLFSDEDWSITAIHEVGHLAGLEHSTNFNAIMYATRDPIRRADIHWDDIEGITFLYPAPNLCDLIPVRMLYPLYASPRSSGTMAAEIRNLGFPTSASLEVTLYVSDSTEFSGMYLGKGTTFIESTGPVEVGFPHVSFGVSQGPRYFGLDVDTKHEVFESDETNNLLAIELPIVPFEPNGDEDLNGLVDWRDLFQLAREWRRTNNQFLELFRFDFGQKYYVGEIDLLLFLERWQENTLPNP